MFKLLTTLVRCTAGDTEERLTDANAPALLRQQLRDATEGLARAKRALAVAAAHRAVEKRGHDRLSARIADLEARAIAALEAGREDLAAEAAAAIAELDEERRALSAALEHYDSRIAARRAEVYDAGRRLRALERGGRLAEAAGRSQALRGLAPRLVEEDLKAAETTLARIQMRQEEAEAAEAELDGIAGEGDLDALRHRLAAAGCGAPVKPDGAAVLARLRARIDAAQAAETAQTGAAASPASGAETASAA